ncbi:restriction endonuclease subunit S, partial [Thalassotalea sp. G20_0]|uniref:restriction endonuclease subunit S n=1 Tax=Thalassotalea sp. G20_0 TaxID=2821093 RepID=UPI001AD997CE
LTPDCKLLGKPAFVDRENLLHNQRIGKVLYNQEKIDGEFLYWIFLSESYESWMKDTATGSTVRHTSVKSIGSAFIPIPPIAEQEAIAKALSDMDALIQSLEQQIIKKQQIKQGAMHSLLNPYDKGGKRKSGWIKTTLGRIGTFSKGSGVTKEQALSGNIPCIRYGELYTRHNNVITSFQSYISESVSA